MAAVAQRAGVVTLAAHATAPPASCPHCGISSRRIQSPYARRPRSFAGGGWRALGLARPPLAWPACQPHDSAVRRTRTGGGPAHGAASRALDHGLAATRGRAWGRRGGTARPQAPAADAPRSRAASRPPAPGPPRATPTGLGVDDWARRPGHTYGPLLVDSEPRRPIDLWPDRPPETLAAWLRAHPGVILSGRDRSPESARGATLGAPAARHGPDRWPLVRDRREPFERLGDRRHQQLAAIPPARSQEVRALHAHGVRRWRALQALGVPGARRMVSTRVVRLPAPRQRVRRVSRPEDAVTPADPERIPMRRHDQGRQMASTLPPRFRQRMRQRTATALDPWLTDGLASEMPARLSFATGVQRERPAGPQALVLPCSHGQGAGQSTQVTLLKRPSDGRAKRDRLRQRMRHAA
jgi:hypothetical protein